MCEYYTQKPADSCCANMLGYLTPLPYNICRGCLGILASMNLVAVLRCFALAGIVCTAENQRGVAPKSLRGSGASWLFHHTEDVHKLLWWAVAVQTHT